MSAAEKDFLWLHLRELPYFRSLVRSVEARFYQDIHLPPPVLDLGCGDGHFASVAFDSPLDVGIDPWVGPLRQAANYQSYRLLVLGDGGKMPFPDGHFASAVSNSVLEHIPHIDAVLSELGRVLRPDAPFVFCVPNHQFLSSLSVGRALDKMRLGKLANLYRLFFNRISRHQHSDSPEAWQARLEKAGFQIERWWHYFPPESMRVVEWGHYLGLPSLICHWLFRRWILVPRWWNLGLTYRLIQRHYKENPVNESGVYTFYIARRG